MVSHTRQKRAQSWPIHARAIAQEFASRYTEEEALQLGELLVRQFADDAA